MIPFEPASFVGFRVHFNVDGDPYFGILESYNPSIEQLVFKYASVYCDGEAVSDFRFRKCELSPLSKGVYMTKDDRDGGKFNQEVEREKSKAMMLEEEEDETENCAQATITNGASNCNTNRVNKVNDLTNDEPWSRVGRLNHITNGHPSASSSSDDMKSGPMSMSSPETSSDSPPKSSISHSSRSDDPNLDNLPEADPIRQLFEECNRQAQQHDSDDDLDLIEKLALNSMDKDVEFWLDKVDLPMIEDVHFIDLRKESFSQEFCDQIIDELLAKYDQISFDIFAESIQRDKPIEYAAICGQVITESSNFDVTIYLFPFQTTNKISLKTKRVINIFRTVIQSKTSKVVHFMPFMAETLSRRHGINILSPKGSLMDTSILDVKHRQDALLRKTVRGHTPSETIFLRPLEECLNDYLDIEITAEFFPNLGNEDEYSCLAIKNEEEELSITAKNFLIRRLALIFPLEVEIKNCLFGLVESGIQLLAGKLMVLENERQASELRLQVKHHGIKADDVLQPQLNQNMLQKLLGKDGYFDGDGRIVLRTFEETQVTETPHSRPTNELVHPANGNNGLGHTNGHTTTNGNTNGHPTTNGHVSALNGTEGKPKNPTKFSHPRQKIDLANGVSAPIPIEESKTKLNGDGTSISPEFGYSPTMHHKLNQMHAQRAARGREPFDWGTPSNPKPAPPPAGTEYKWWQRRNGENLIALNSRRTINNRAALATANVEPVTVGKRAKQPHVMELTTENLQMFDKANSSSSGRSSRMSSDVTIVVASPLANPAGDWSRLVPRPVCGKSQQKSSATYMVPVSLKCPGLKRRTKDEQERFRKLKAAEAAGGNL